MKLVFFMRGMLVFFAATLPALAENVEKSGESPTAKSAVSLADDPDFNEQHEIFLDAMKKLNTNYIDGQKVSSKMLFENAIKGMTASLDKYSGYTPPGELATQRTHIGYEKTNLGIIFAKRPNQPLQIEFVWPESPAARSGLAVFDEITAIDGIDIRAWDREAVTQYLSGKWDENILFTVDNPQKTSRNVKVLLAEYNLPSVPSYAARRLAGGIGYIRVDFFHYNTGSEFDATFARLNHDEPLRALILDLRENGGGTQEGAIDLCSRFLETGKLIESIVSRHDTQSLYTVDCAKTDIPLAVLINCRTASASEITAGCLKDHHRATLIGTRTFGKGIGQRGQSIRGGGVLSFTAFKMITPNGNSYNKIGIEPDIAVEIPGEYAAVWLKLYRSYPGEFEIDGWHDPQIAAAVEQFKNIPAPPANR